MACLEKIGSAHCDGTEKNEDEDVPPRRAAPARTRPEPEDGEVETPPRRVNRSRPEPREETEDEAPPPRRRTAPVAAADDEDDAPPPASIRERLRSRRECPPA